MIAPVLPFTSRVTQKVLEITGWCSPEKANDLALAVLKTRASFVVEIGVWGGRSCIPMAMACAEQQHGVVWAIDPWSPAASVDGYDGVNANWWGIQDHEAVYRSFLGIVKSNGLDQYVKVIRSKSDLVKPPEVIDVLHLDGNHSEQTVRDVMHFAIKVRPGGFCYIDDIEWSGGFVKLGVEKLLTMGFTRLFDRDTGAMFQRDEKKTVVAVEEPVKRKPGRPKGSKNKKRS
jgi:predicted O-methyltransferase YrrM